VTTRAHEESARREALAGVLWQLADDDLVVAHRASEWLGLHPHVEEDVAWASIAQDELGHAALYYGMLEELGWGARDDLAYLRSAGERRNSVLLEWPNGPGYYADNPRFDWAFTLMRHFAYDTMERLRLERLTRSSYAPLADAARKILREEHYHGYHHETWIRRLATHDATTRERLNRAGAAVAALAGDLCDPGPWAPKWDDTALYPDSQSLRHDWEAAVSRVLAAAGLDPWPSVPPLRNGRRGEHSPYLTELLETLTAVRRLDPAARW
jgi:ring-1,2-phenylacetyl-CoA epoxidase subunit PaaC